ncbi:MAG TPA: thermonuclease family protein [Candidatus Paceibacterota bacterium]|nr:thermonuclease family protein [Candidatus Paceibacterota bacterium]
MRTTLAVIAVLLSGLFFSIFPHPTAPARTYDTATSFASTTAQSDQWYPVERVVDGDTLVVGINGSSTKIRLIGVDTPETVDPRKPVQCFGEAASAEAKKILSGQSVRIEYDLSQGMLDKYGRTLAYIYVPLNSKPEGLLFNEYLIAEGYGHEYTYNLPYKYQKEFKAAERAARDAKKGLWADDACARESAR